MAEQSRGPSFQSHERPPGPSSPSGAMDLKYDVFLTQWGRCPSEGFMSHLWDELRSVGLNPFLQEKSLAKGDDALGSIDAELAVEVKSLAKGDDALGSMSHLWDELRSAGLNPFLQEKSLAKGDDALGSIDAELAVEVKSLAKGDDALGSVDAAWAVEGKSLAKGDDALGSIDAALAVARVHVVVMSGGYDSDPNGLRNLVATMRSGKPFIPVLWNVYPTDLHRSTSLPSYFDDDISPVERMTVLEELTMKITMNGFMMFEGDEARLTCEVVNYLSNELMPLIVIEDLERILKAYPAIQDLGLDADHRPTCNGYTTRVLGVLDTLADYLEFYFENRENMANIVGVGLQYGKAIVTPGFCIEAVEMDEDKWKYMWFHRATIGTRFSRVKVFHVTLPVTIRGQVYENRGHEDSDLGTSSSYDGTFQEHALGISYRQVQGPFLWELSKYFIVKNAMDGFYVNRDTPTLGESFTLGVPSETGGVTRGGMGIGSLKERLSSLSVDFKSNQGKQGGNGDGGDGGNDGDDSDGDDSDGDDNRDGQGKGKNVSRERKVTSTKVFINLRSGGDFFDMDRKPIPFDQLKLSNLVIEPFLSLDFQKTREETGEVNKEILCTVGPVTFCLPRKLDYFESDGRFGWFHDELCVSLGPKFEDDTEVSLLKESEAEDCMDGKITYKASSSIEAGSSHEGGVQAKLVLGNTNIARGEVGGDYRKGMRDSNSQSHEQSLESPCKQTEGGFYIQPIRTPREAKLEYCYTAPSSQIIPDNIKDPSCREWLSRHSPLCRQQRTEYSGGWDVLGDADSLTYNFKAERKLRMLVEEAVEEKSERSPSALSSVMKKKRKMPEEVTTTIQESAPMFQTYKKDILINLAMTHLVDGKTFKLNHGRKQPNWGGGVPLAIISDPPIEPMGIS